MVLKCPHCNIELFFKTLTERPDFNENTCCVTWYGTCHKCYKHYTWDEVYNFSHCENLEEEKELE